MKLLRYGNPRQEKPGMLDQNGTVRDLSNIVEDISGDVLLPEGLEKLKNLDPDSLPTIEGSPRMGACVSGIGKFICIGLNYSDHAEVTGASVPSEPIIFSKATSAVCGPDDDIIIPRNSVKTDWEVELGVVIGKPAKYVEEASALDHVAGYCVINEKSIRDDEAVHPSAKCMAVPFCHTSEATFHKPLKK